MNNKILISIVLTFILAFVYCAEAQQTTKIPRIGFLVASTPSNYVTRIETFRQAMRELGYVEGKNIDIEYRFAEGKQERLREIAAEFVSLKVDVFVTAANATAAKEATKTIPVVFAAISDPVATGIVDSLARPGGNLTGLSVFAPELTGKRLELLKEAAPKITRVAFLWNPSNRGDTDLWKDAEAASLPLGLQIRSLEVSTLADFDNAFATATKEKVNALTMTLKSLYQYLSSADLGLRRKESTASDLRRSGHSRSRRPDVLWTGLHRAFPAPRDLRRQDFERCQASRPAGRAADEV